LPYALETVEGQSLIGTQGVPADRHQVIQPPVAITIDRKEIEVPMSAQRAAVNVFAAQAGGHTAGVTDYSLVESHQLAPDALSHLERRRHRRSNAALECEEDAVHLAFALGAPGSGLNAEAIE
jgi:hypothetical protein